MDNNESYTEKLVQYLDGDLTGAELEDVERQLAEKKELQQELDNLSLAKKAVQSYGLKARVASVHQQMMQELKEDELPAESKIYPFIRTTLKYAASILLLLSLTGTYFYLTSSSAKLYKDNYVPYQLSVTRGESTSSALEKEFIAKNYTGVISTFKSLPNPTNKDYFLVAQVYQLTGEPNKAIRYYRLLSGNSVTDNSFKDDAEYYLALAYLENNDPVAAKPIFEKIHADPDQLYHDNISYWTLLKVKLLALKAEKK